MDEALKEKALQALSELLDLALQAKDFAVEQVAQQLGQSGGMGIADLIYEQLSNE